MDTTFVWNVVLTIVMALIGGAVALGAKYLAQIQKTLEERMKLHDEQLGAINQKIEDAQEDLGQFKVHVQREFVSRDDYIRVSQGMDAKIERIFKEISKINVNVARLATMQEVGQDDNRG